MARLEGATLLDPFLPLRAVPGRFALAAYLMELLDRLSPEAQKMKGDEYHNNGPEGELAALILDRIRDRETAAAKKAMDERDAAIREANGAG